MNYVIDKERKNMPGDYVDNPEIEKIAKTLYGQMDWVEEPNVKFLMLMADESQYLGKCSKATGKWKYLTNMDYIVEVWNCFWDSADQHDREALLMHELMHIESAEKKDGSLVWKIRKHDVEEFLDVTKRYGLWSPPLIEIGKIINPVGQNKE